MPVTGEGTCWAGGALDGGATGGTVTGGGVVPIGAKGFGEAGTPAKGFDDGGAAKALDGGALAAPGGGVCGSARSSAEGGLARNIVLHLGQRMRAPSEGTASLRTR